MEGASDLTKFLLVMRKNWILNCRNKKATFLTILVPIGIFGLLALIRAYSPSYEFPKVTTYVPQGLNGQPDYFNVRQFAYAPKNYTNEMAKVDQALHMTTAAIGFDTEQEMMDFIQSENVTQKAGVVFKLDNEANLLRIVLRFYSDTPWMTEDLWPVGARLGHRNPHLANGGFPPGYYPRGFVHVQNAIFNALNGPSQTSVMLNRLPIQSFNQDTFLDVMGALGAPLLIFAFFMSFITNVKNIIQEKESQLKEMLLIMGLPNYIAWLAWLTKCMLENLLVSIIGIVLLKYPFKNDISCFHHSSPTVLWLLLIIFILSLSAFSALISTLFRSSKRAITFLSLIFLLSMGPAWMAKDVREFGAFAKAFTVLSCTSAFGYAVKLITMFEDMGVGLQWRYLFTSPGHGAFSVGLLMLFMLLATVGYLLLALYIEQVCPGDFGTPRKWYYPVERFVGKRRDYIELDSVAATTASTASVRREEPRSNAVAGISITNLTKVYGSNFVAVNNLSMTIHENEITVLLGENGAGKSTLMSMLTGVLSPTGGSATIKGLDLRQDLKAIRNSIGLCPQQNVLFGQLTVEEHLVMFAQLKGMSRGFAEMEAHEYMDRLALLDKANTRADQLSGGMKRKLNLAIALCGNTKVVFLDEPTSGVDVESRREIYAILEQLKRDRTILLSTHFMDEADMLADTVAILHNGTLKCVGSAIYLKTLFESSYKLTCALVEHATVEPVAELIGKYVPDAKLRDSFGQEVAFDLNPQYVKAFGELCRALEDTEEEGKTHSHGVESFGIELPSLEEVFFKVQQEDERPRTAFDTRLQVDGGSTGLLSGLPLYLNQFKALAKKKFYFNLRNPFSFLIQFFFPTLLLCYAIYSQNVQFPRDTGRELRLGSYGGDVVTLMEVQDGSDAALVERYEQQVNSTGSLVTVDTINSHIAGMTPWEYNEFKYRSVVGALFTKDRVLAMFSNEAYHSVPISLTNVYNALIQGKNAGAPQLLFVNHPIPVKLSGAAEQFQRLSNYYTLALMLSFGVISTAAGLCQGYVQERESGAMTMQFIAGCHPVAYWTMSFLVDLFVYALSVATVIIVAAFDHSSPQLWQFYQVLFLYGWAALPFGYLRARRFKKAADLTSDLNRLGFICLVLYFVVYLGATALGYINQQRWEMFFMVVPQFNLVDGVLKYALSVAGLGDSELLWKNKVMFGVTGGVCLVLVVLHESQAMRWVYSCCGWLGKGQVEAEEDEALDEDVRRGVERVDAMTEEEVKEQYLVARHLRKTFGRKAAVKDATFVLERGECLGLLGRNGAGKTSTFKMLTGEEEITAGNAFLKGISIKNDLLRTYTHFGYCPQFDALLGELTGSEWLEIVALIRGVPTAQVGQVSLCLAHELGFEKHLVKRVSAMSGGNKRKLSTAVALIGDPKVIYADEPSTGMDPSAKRCVWNVVTSRRSRGDSVVLTSHSMEECEALCTRVIILLEGRMEAMATIYRLKQKFSKMGHLVIQLRRNRATGQNLTELKEVLQSKLRDLKSRGESEGKLEFEFNAQEKLSKLFGLMESLREEYHIESYVVSNQNRLVNLFLDRETR